MMRGQKIVSGSSQILLKSRRGPIIVQMLNIFISHFQNVFKHMHIRTVSYNVSVITVTTLT